MQYNEKSNIFHINKRFVHEVVNIKGENIKQLDMRNVLKTTVVNWTGGTVEEFACKNCEHGGKINEE